MPGVKRKATKDRTAGAAAASSSKAVKKISGSRKAQHPPTDRDDEASGSSSLGSDGDDDDDFDDGEDLMQAAKSGKYDDDAAEGPGMTSDEDMDGGFEDLEDGDDDDDDDGHYEEGEDEDAEAANGASSKRTKGQEALYAPPTNEEMQGLRETGELFKSNILKLQIEEMLNNVRPSSHRAAPMEFVLRRLHALFKDLKPIAPQAVADSSKAIKKHYPSSKIAIPFLEPHPKADSNYKFAFEPPAGLQLVGSWPLKSATLRPEGFDVDLAVVMPSTIFQEKDHLNFRYFHKRAFYLAVLAAAITSQKELGVEAKFEFSASDRKRPILVLRPVSDKGDADFTRLKATIRIHLTHDADLFPIGRLAPSRNNIRTSTASAEGSDASQPATPLYNSAILEESLKMPHLVYLHATAKACPAFQDAASLLKVWAFQRGFGSGALTKGNRRLALGASNARFVLTMLLAHLLHGEQRVPGRAANLTPRAKLANGFSSYQLFRGVIDWLAHHDFVQQPVFMKPAPDSGLPSRSDKIPREDFLNNFERVMVDPSGQVNLIAHWLPGTLDLLQHEARLTFSMMTDAETDHFDEMFLDQRSSPLFVFDDCARLTLPATPSSLSLKRLECGSTREATGAALVKVAQRALSTRSRCSAAFVAAEDAQSRCWAVGDQANPESAEIEVATLYDAALAFRLVEHGPAPEDKEAAAAFQSFWGDAAELRRFKDGNIVYSVVWEIAGQSERWSIPRRIIRHVLQHHLSLDGQAINFDSEAFDGLVERPNAVIDQAYLASPDEKGFHLVQAAFDGLSKQLRAMDDLPLSLISITPNSAGLRSTSTFVPAPLNLNALGSTIPVGATHLPGQDIVLTFESSGRWPDDLKAIQAMKLAFFERLATLLPSKISGLVAFVALDDDAEQSEIQDCASLELVLPSGFAYRARIHHDRERVLLDRIISDKRGETPARRDEAERCLKRWEKRFVSGPQHHAAMATLQHRYASLGPTVRHLKRWLSGQMLDGHISEELVELLAASIFICPGATMPSSGAAGFLQVLKKLALWNWKEEPLLLPLQAAVLAPDEAAQRTIRFPTDKRVEVTDAFKKARQVDPSLSRRAWFIATEDDVASERWSDVKEGPSGPIAHTVQALAKGVCALLGSVEALTPPVARAFFVPSTKPFDFLIHFRPQVLTRYAEALSPDLSVLLAASRPGRGCKSFRNRAITSGSSDSASLLVSQVPRVDFDPARSFVGLLRTLYGDTLRLHHDVHGGAVVGGMFNPLLSEGRRFKVGLGFNSEPVHPEEEKMRDVKLNRKAVLTEVQKLGEGLIERVDLLKT